MTLAVLVCGWAHVLHAMYKPWGAGTAMYALQHGSLLVTTFVFLMVSRLMWCVARDLLLFCYNLVRAAREWDTVWPFHVTTLSL